MAQETERNCEQPIDWASVFLGTLLFPFLLTEDFVEEYKKELSAIEKEEEEKENVKEDTEKCPLNQEQEQEQELDHPLDEPVELVDHTEDKDLDELHEGGEYTGDPVFDEFGNVDADEFVESVFANNSHEDYFQLSAFVRDALVDLQKGTNECGWTYDPNGTVVELELDDYVAIDDPTATLMNYTLGHLPFSVYIEKRIEEAAKNKKRVCSYVLVVEL